VFLDAGNSVEDAESYCEERASRALQINEVQNAYSSIKKTGILKRQRWSKPNQQYVDFVKRTASGGLYQSILNRLTLTRAEEIDCFGALKLLFPDDIESGDWSLICCGASQSDFRTAPLAFFKDKCEDLQFIVPSTMSSIWGETQGGDRSQHTLSNTGPRKYLVVEFDKGEHAEHAAFLHNLHRIIPITMVVHSGNKSLHGWFHVEGMPETKQVRFFDEATQLGADTATWNRSLFVRMPDGKRANGKRQSILYFNHPKYQTPIS
tara:strand:- start:1040 stop:1831 length:792 start_codon:yes stop_codon:yes gene_type:complete